MPFFFLKCIFCYGCYLSFFGWWRKKGDRFCFVSNYEISSFFLCGTSDQLYALTPNSLFHSVLSLDYIIFQQCKFTFMHTSIKTYLHIHICIFAYIMATKVIVLCWVTACLIVAMLACVSSPSHTHTSTLHSFVVF